ncbi:hypothetical protein FACS1894137_05550 [Spirochaetia bacterium]|nr:hypothetical protein FACS1894137_05550 [Spirochaetia bacterium]
MTKKIFIGFLLMVAAVAGLTAQTTRIDYSVSIGPISDADLVIINQDDYEYYVDLYNAIRNQDAGSPNDYSTKTVTKTEFGKYLNSAAGIPETAVPTILGIISEYGEYTFFSKSTNRWIYAKEVETVISK